jgi:hypothetical protein
MYEKKTPRGSSKLDKYTAWTPTFVFLHKYKVDYAQLIPQ